MNPCLSLVTRFIPARNWINFKELIHLDIRAVNSIIKQLYMNIRGKLVFEKDLPDFSGADVYVMLEDVGRIDAGADILQKETLSSISHKAGETNEVEFQIESEESGNDHPRYNLRAHVDISGNGEVEKGDFVTTQSYPVFPGESKKHELKLKEV